MFWRHFFLSVLERRSWQGSKAEMNDYYSSPQKINTILVIACGVAILGVVGFLIWNNRTNVKLAESQDWPSTTGTIVSTNIKIGSETVGFGSNERTMTVYVPGLKYAYNVAGLEYTSEKITVLSSWGMESFDTRDEAEAFLKNNYPVGTRVAVYYDRDNPEDAFIFKKDPTSTGAISFIMYAIIAFLGVLMIYILLNLDKPLK
jgi:hypothetical protein